MVRSVNLSGESISRQGLGMVGIGRKKVDEMIWLKRGGGKARESGGGVVQSG